MMNMINIQQCTSLNKTMPIGAFVVFVGSFIIFLYLMIDDFHKTAPGERSKEDTMWIYIFFVMLATCVIVSGLCIVRTNNTNNKIGKKVNKQLDLLTSNFRSKIPTFEGKKIF